MYTGWINIFAKLVTKLTAVTTLRCMKKLLVVALSTVLLISGFPANAAIKAGAVCKTKGQVKVSGDREFTCIKKGSKLVWSKGKIVITSKKVKKTPIPFSASPTPVESAQTTPTVSAKPISIPTESSQLPTPIITIRSQQTRFTFKVDIFVPNFNAGINLKNSYLVIRSIGNPKSGSVSFCELQKTLYRGNSSGNAWASTEIFLNKPEGSRGGVVINLSTIPNTYNCKLAMNTEYEAYIFVGDSNGKKIAVSDGVQIIVGELSPTPTPKPTITSTELIIMPGSFCAPAGATGKSSKGVDYTCKTSDTDSRSRWRQ
jgi:hypothetical protein